MTTEIKVLGQQPVRVSLAGQEIDIFPPTSYRLDQILACAAKAKEENAGTTGLIGKTNYDILRLICKTKDVFANGQLVEGIVPEVLKEDLFWAQQVQTAEIAGLFEVFVDLINIDKLLKNAVALMGR